MTKIRRRNALRLSAAGALAAGSGGLAGILASGRAPAYAQGQTMHWLRWADFVPASDQLLKGDITKECEKALGMKLTVETINANDIQARITAAIQSGAGPDIFLARVGEVLELCAEPANLGDGVAHGKPAPAGHCRTPHHKPRRSL